MVHYGGEVIPHQEAPSRPGASRAAQGALAPTPELAQVVRNLSQFGFSRLQLQRLAALEAAVAQHQVDDEAPRSGTPPTREATPRKQALWKAVHHARLQGVPLRGIARELGISRNTVRKCVDSMAPPVNRAPRRSTQSPTQLNADGHCPWTSTPQWPNMPPPLAVPAQRSNAVDESWNKPYPLVALIRVGDGGSTAVSLRAVSLRSEAPTDGQPRGRCGGTSKNCSRVNRVRNPFGDGRRHHHAVRGQVRAGKGGGP